MARQRILFWAALRSARRPPRHLFGHALHHRGIDGRAEAHEPGLCPDGLQRPPGHDELVQQSTCGHRPIQQTSGGPEKTPDAPDTRSWKTFRAPSKGIALINLGDNQDAEVGDVVYAVATIEAGKDKSVALHLGASSEAMAWLNGEKIAYLPNVKGVQRDEFTDQMKLNKGPNVLLLKLSRFWERQWMFYAAVSE